MRANDMHHNVEGLPYASMPLVWYIDKYNAMGMTNKVRMTVHGFLPFHVRR